MLCPKCGSPIKDGETECANCQIIDKDSSETKDNFTDDKNKTEKKEQNFISILKNNKKKIIILFIIIIIGVIGFFTYKGISNYNYQKNLYYTFKIGKKVYRIGEKVSYYEDNGYSYKDEYYDSAQKIPSEGFMPYLFYRKKEPVFYGGLYCDEEKSCSYSNSRLIKINFYDNIGNLELADFIKIGTSYKRIEKELGEPDGVFYMNDNEYVWAFYDKGEIGNPYYVLEFDKDDKVSGIKIGVWWYDGEYEDTVKEK